MTQPVPRPRQSSPAPRDIVVGATVYGSDNGRFGQVAGTYRDFLIVERGFFMPVDYYVPMSAIGRVDGDLVVLSVSRDAALTQGWERPPFTSETGQRGPRRSTVGRADPTDPTAPTERRGDQPAIDPAAARTSWPATPPRTVGASVAATRAGADAATRPAGDTGRVVAGDPADRPTGAPSGFEPAGPGARPAVIPATGAFADTYAVGTNTESYHAMEGFPADPVPASPDQPMLEGAPPTPTGSATAPAATASPGPVIPAATDPAGQDVAGGAPPTTRRDDPVDPDRPAQTDADAPGRDAVGAEAPPVERPAP